MTNLETNLLKVLTREAVRFCSMSVRLFSGPARANAYGPHTGLPLMVFTFGRVIYKMKTLVKFVHNRKSSCSLFLLRLFCTFGRVMYKTKTLVKFVDNRKSCCSLFLLRSRIMFEPFLQDFKIILTGPSFLGLSSSVFVLYPPLTQFRIQNDIFYLSKNKRR